MNTFTKLNAKTLMQLFAIVMITLTLFSCHNDEVATTVIPPETTTPNDDTATPPDTTPPTDDSTTDPTASAPRVSTLSALATGTPSQVNIYWSEVAEATSYKLYKSTTTLSSYQGTNPTNLSTSSIVTMTTHTIKASTITLSGTQTFYFLVTAIKDGTESFTNATQTAATAFATPFLTVVSTGTGSDATPTFATNRVWMDRNLGANQVAISFDDILAYGDLYQWGRPRDGHQARTSTTRAIIAGSITPTHGDFIYSGGVVNGDWTSADDDGALRSAYWARIDGSSICPTGFRVPTNTELVAERESWSSDRAAYNSNLKWPAARYRDPTNAVFALDGAIGIWSTTAGVNSVSGLKFALHIPIQVENFARAYGNSVRCIKPL